VGFESIIREMAEDQVHGASWYFKRAIDAARAAVGTVGVDRLVSALRSVRPGMASLEFVVTAITRFGLNMNTVEALRRYGDSAALALAEAGRRRGGGAILTISYSSAVASAFGQSIRYALESKPGSEAVELARRFPWIRLVPDLAMAQFAGEVDCIAMGADGIYSGVVLNKVGSLPLALVARRLGKPLLVVAESFKVLPRDVDCGDIHSVEINGLKVKLFDCVPNELVYEFITDVGEFKPGGNLASDIHEAAMNELMKFL